MQTFATRFCFVISVLLLGFGLPVQAHAAHHPAKAHAAKVRVAHVAQARGTRAAGRSTHGREARPAGRTRASRVSARVSSRAAGRGRGRSERVAVTTHLVRGRHGRMVRVVVRDEPVRVAPVRVVERFHASPFALNQTVGDLTAGEDPIVRAAAIEALGNINGTAMAIDPATGRVLAMVNQKLALSRGAEPCSTIKLTVALAALQEGIVRRDTPVALQGGSRVNLTQALAHSNNLYFETLGRALGFERVKHYANQLGLGELAGYNIAGEQLGTYPDQELPSYMGGVGRMCSFGESVSMTPLQLGAIVSAIANGGTLYYMQHPTTTDEITALQPRIKRTLDIRALLPEMADGMQGAVNYGTARSLRTSFTEFPVMGKTGTCSNNGTRFGWFGSYADTPNGRIVTVIFTEGDRRVSGPKAAEVTGQFYRALYDKNYFAPKAITGMSAMGTR